LIGSSRSRPMNVNRIEQDFKSHSSGRVKADYKPEVFFLGQIVGGTDFPTDSDGLFVEGSLRYGENW
jgi:hypothetical protein